VTSAAYSLFIDWDADGSLVFGDFEFGTEGWTASSSGATGTITLDSLSTRFYHGTKSLRVTWASGGTIQLVQRDFPGLIVGRSYTFGIWVWVPSTNGVHVTTAVSGIGFGDSSTLTDTWHRISITFTATTTTHIAQLWAAGPPSPAGKTTWVDWGRMVGAGEEITATAPGVISDVSVQFGRDQARSLLPVGPGEASFEVDNVSRELSPENSSSSLAGLLGPGRDVLLEATHAGQAYTVYRGSLDNFDIDTAPGSWVAKFSCVDLFARIKGLPVSTELYPVVRTGEALNYILDAIGWTNERDIDPGGSFLRWWHAESGDAHADVQDILVAEGPGCYASIGPSSEFIFRDRHHRILRPASTTSQVTFTSGTATGGQVEVDDFTIDFGFRDLINMVEFTVTPREPEPVPSEIWLDETPYVFTAGQTREFNIITSDPFWEIQTPTQGAPDEVPTGDPATYPPDFIRTTALTVAFSRNSGRSVVMSVTAAAASVVTRMAVRAHKVVNGDAVKVTDSDATSIAKSGVHAYKPSSQWLSVEDAQAIAELVIRQRATRLPVVRFTVVNGTATALTHQLARDLSDRVTVVDTESGFSADCFIEHIAHTITDDGNTHRTVFSCEKVAGLDDAATVFLFDVSGHGFDDGLLAT
jgi:hypothetical protein